MLTSRSSSTGQLIGAAEPKAFQLLAYRRRVRRYCSLSCLTFCSWWASSSSVASSSVAAGAWEVGDVPGLGAGSVAGAEVPAGEILACVVAGDLKAAPVALIVGARTEEVQEVLMGEAAAREVRACVPKCKTYS